MARTRTTEVAMRRCARRAMLACCWLVATIPAAWAHGGVSIEDDKCVLRLGGYLMHFTGYQPEQTGAQEFCEDIPITGLAVIVLDAIDDALRDMPIEVRVLRDANDLGNDARVEELGGEAAIEAATLARLPAALHPTGSLTLKYAFAEPGRYIGYVRARPAVGDEVIAVFPFAVGGGSRQWQLYAAVIVGTVLLAAALFAVANRARHAPTA
ncbi:MAG: hypothetical protein AB7O21_19880 [Gammaproteobacteria bacterium]